MKLPAYPRYKPSGVEWLGDVPEHWEVKRLGYVTQCLDGKRVPLNSEDRSDRRGSYPYWGANNIVDHIDAWLFDEPLVLLGEDGAPFFERNKTVAFFVQGKVWVNNHAHVIRPAKTCEPRYLTYALNQTQYGVFIDGSTRDKLTQADMNSIPVAYPPLAEQQAIAAFLDRETGWVDRLVAKKRELIERLKEKRTALISRAVTRGVPAEAARVAGFPESPPLKPSGIEWIGDVPEHWEVVRLGRRIELQRGVDITKDEQSEGPIPVVSSGGIASFHDTAFARGPGVVVGRKGTAGAVYYVECGYWPHDTTLYVREFRDNHPRYVFYKLCSMDLASFDTGSANPTLNRNLIHPVFVSWPPIPEQAAIAAYLDAETAKLDALVAKVELAVERLLEYRTSLITAAVTGKIDVRSKITI